MGIADALAIAVAVSLPWSTSATVILVILWALSLIAMFDLRALRATVMTPAGGLPVLLVLLGALGMAWADVDVMARLDGAESFLKLLAIPLLLIQFQRSGRGLWVLGAFVFSCTVLLIATALIMLVPPLAESLLRFDNVIVKNAASQSGEFVLCVFGLAYVAVEAAERRQWRWFAGIALIMIGMLTSMAFLATGRTALVTIPVLLVLFAVRRLSARAAAAVLAGAAVLAAVAWSSAPYLRERTVAVWTETRNYLASNEQNSSGERLAFYTYSLGFISEAPVIGHGTGTITKLFAEVTAGKTGAAGSATTNPHNQTLAVAIQTGLIGA
ncbi:MAG: O-antigen ligase family protein, partial [Pseudomonadota bacterium]|nr:O-antigen ligase family protein [Pseudomonadota bacterium]